MNRRQFLKRVALASLLGLVPISPWTAFPASWAALGADDNPNKPRLIVIFLRGAVDGLNVVPPHGETSYYAYRPTIGLARPGQPDGILNLDGFFGLHPALAPLMPLWQQRSLAFVQAAGSPDPSRSHFEAQDFMESATPGNPRTPDGWMNRLFGILPGAHSPIAAVSFGETTPKSLMGHQPVATMPLGRGVTHPQPIDRSDLKHVFDAFYTDNSPLSRAYREGMTARQTLMADLVAEMKAADNGAPSPVGFSLDAQQLAGLIQREPRVELAFLALGGWDTHVNEGSHSGQLANHLSELGKGLYTLATNLGPAYDNTIIVVMSEFGRTARENSDAGTDHGHGNVMWVMGGRVHGGKVYGQWPGLSPSQLYQGRDLAVTTDFRDVLSLITSTHFSLPAPQLTQVFPHYTPSYHTLRGLL